MTAEPAIVVDEDIDDQFVEASLRGSELNVENSQDAAVPVLPMRSPFDEPTRSVEQNIDISNNPMPLSPTRFPFPDEHETASFSASDLARSQQYINQGRMSPFVAANAQSQAQPGSKMRNDALPPIPHENLGRTQHGVTVRRAVNKCRRMSMVNSAKLKSVTSLDNVNMDSGISPFDQSISSRNMDSSYNGSTQPLSPSPHRQVREIESPSIMKVDSGQYT